MDKGFSGWLTMIAKDRVLLGTVLGQLLRMESHNDGTIAKGLAAGL